MVAFIVTIFYCLATTMAGYCLLRLLGAGTCSDHLTEILVRLITSFLLGIGVTSSVWLLIGVMSWLGSFVVIGFLVGFCILGLLLARTELRIWMVALRSSTGWLPKQMSVEALLVGLCLGLMGLLAIGALLKPPIGDAEAFYMVYPKVIAASQRLVEMPGLYANFSQIGLLGEMHFAALLVLADVHTAKLFAWFVAMATVGMLIALARLAGLGRTGCAFVFLIAATTTAFTNHITDGKIDLFSTACGIGAFYWALRSAEGSEREQRGALQITGVLAGFAVVGKFSYLLAFLPPLFVIISWNLHERWRLTGPNTSWKMVQPVAAYMTVGVAMMAAAVPHLIKNGVLFAAPLAPFVGMEGTSWLNQTWFSSGDTAWIVATYPAALVFGRYPMQGGNLSFLWLAFLPLLLVRSVQTFRNNRTLAKMTVAGLVGTLLWVLLRPSVIAPRYLLATLFLLIPSVALAAEGVFTTEARPRILSTGIVLVSLLALGIFTFPHAKLPLHLIHFLRGTFPVCGLASPYCEPLVALNQQAEPGARVFFAGYYSYWMRPDLLQCRDDRSDAGAFAKESDASSRWATLYTRGFHYVVIDKTSHRTMISLLDQSMAPPWLDVEEILKTDELSVLKLSSRTHDRTVELDCTQRLHPAWDVTRVSWKSGRVAEGSA
jgi:hypothetical protein